MPVLPSDNLAGKAAMRCILSGSHLVAGFLSLFGCLLFSLPVAEAQEEEPSFEPDPLPEEEEENEQGAIAPIDVGIGPYGSGFHYQRPVSSQFGITLGGRFKLDAFFDTQQINSDLPFFAEPAQIVAQQNGQDVLVANPNDLTNSFNLSVRELNLMAMINTPKFGEWSTFGYFEANFFGFFANAAGPSPVLRFAYFSSSNEKTGTSILAGQAEGPFSPLDPQTLNAETLVLFGNPFTGLPQVRLTQTIGKLKLEGAVVRPADLFNDVLRGSDVVGRGQDSGLPEVQGRVSYTFTEKTAHYWYYPTPGTIGLSGRFARERFHAGTDAQEDVNSFTASLDWIVPLGERITFQGEAYWGKNTDNILGLSGVVGVDNDGLFDPTAPIEELGGWAYLGYTFHPKLFGAVSYGITLPDADAFAQAGLQEDSGLDITRNEGATALLLWRFLPTSLIGLEYTRLVTERFLRLDGNTDGALVAGVLHRIQLGFLFSF